MLNLFTALTATAAEGHHAVTELPWPTWVYGVAVFAILMFLLLATMSLRSVAIRHQNPTTDVAANNSGRRPGNSA